MGPLGDEPLRRGVVAVIPRHDQLLVIQRAAHVVAPGTYCFPGGGLEPGESAEDALRRELREELDVDVVPQRPVWHCVTPWRVDLSWWLADLDPAASLRPNPAEIASVQWLTIEEIHQLPTLLTSNHRFLQAFQRGEFTLLA
ncbi:MAG: NUDIX domain-containing protein [Pirellulaceae bacterium]